MKKAFTLAEVLITLGIIGIVSALTIPSLINQYKEKVIITHLQKAYTLLQQATQLMIQEEGTIDNFGTDETERLNVYAELLPKYLNVSKACPVGDRTCVPFQYLGLGYTWANSYRNLYLNNGVILALKIGGECIQDVKLQNSGCRPEEVDPGCKHPFYNGTYVHRCGTIYVDINGMNEPNTLGKDLFEFVIVKDGIVPAGLPQEPISGFDFKVGCLENKSKCTAWILHNKNMDYLRCPEKLDWDKASSCKN